MNLLAKTTPLSAISSSPSRWKSFPVAAWLVVLYNLLVILWGAYVRATGSGAGCGSHWPLCDGQVIPRANRIETLIEYTHRVSSGLAFVLVIGLVIWGLRVYSSRVQLRLALGASALFIVTEAALGAGLVLFELVGENDSLFRAFAVALHLANTFLLLASLSLTAWWASGRPEIHPQAAKGKLTLLGIALVGFILVGMSGAVTALGDTLFPSLNLQQGLQQDLNPASHFLIRLRAYHPVLAILVGGFTAVLTRLIASRSGDPSLFGHATALGGLIFLQLLAGAVNLLLLAPIWMQLVHLLLADLVWIGLVLFSAQTFALGSKPSRPEPSIA